MTESKDKQNTDGEWRQDNVVNAFSGVGGKRDRGRYTRPALGQKLGEREVLELYLYGRFARRAVDRPPADCTRRGWTIEVSDGDSDPFADDLKRLEVKKKFRKAHELSRLRGGAGVLMIVDDDQPLDEPIGQNVRGVKALHAFSAPELVPNTYVQDIESPDFGKPKTYFLHPRSGNVTGFGGWENTVHADRVIRFEGMSIPEDYVAETYTGWQQPFIESIWPAMSELSTAAQAIESAMHEFQFGILKLKNLAKLITSENAAGDGLQARLDAIELGKSYLKSIVLDSEEDYELRETKFSGLIDAYAAAQQNFSSATGIPLTLFFGQAPKGFSTGDETGLQNYYDMIREMQIDIYEPAIGRVVGLLERAMDDPPKSWGVQFLDLETPDETEEATIEKTRAETDAMNIDRGVYGPDEARTRYDSPGKATDLVLNSTDSDSEFASLSAEFDRLKEAGELDGDPVQEEPAKDTPEQATDKPKRDFNGAQIGAMQEVVRSVSAEEVPEKGAIEILKLGFNLTETEARAFFDGKEEATRAAKADARQDKYTGPGDPDLPESVQDMSEDKREQFVEVFNATFDEEIAKPDSSEDDADEAAFKAAFAAVAG